MLISVAQFASKPLGNTAQKGGMNVSLTRNLSKLGSEGIQNRGFRSSPVAYKDFKSSVTPGKSPDGDLLSRLKDKAARWCASADIKSAFYKLEIKTLIDADKIGPWHAEVEEHSYGILSKEGGGKSRFLDVKVKGEIKGAQVNLATGVSTSAEIYAGKFTIQGEAGLKNFHLTEQSRINVTRGMGLGYVFIGLKDQVLSPGGEGGATIPSLKNVRMELCKRILSAQLEKRDLQDGTLVMTKLNLANALSWVQDGLKPGAEELPDPSKMVTIEKKVFDAGLNQAYRALGKNFAQAFAELKKAGVLEKLDETVEHELGDWRSDGEGWSTEALGMLKLDILKSTLLANALGLSKGEADAVPVYRLATRLFDEFVEGKL